LRAFGATIVEKSSAEAALASSLRPKHTAGSAARLATERRAWALANLPRLKILVTTGDTLKNVLPGVLGKILPKPYALSDLLRRVKYALAT
jgi:hypothetical protein